MEHHSCDVCGAVIEDGHKRSCPMKDLPTLRNGSWYGGDSRTLYAFTDVRTGRVFVRPGGVGALISGIGEAATVAVATREQAESLWQSPLHDGWRVDDTMGGK